MAQMTYVRRRRPQTRRRTSGREDACAPPIARRLVEHVHPQDQPSEIRGAVATMTFGELTPPVSA